MVIHPGAFISLLVAAVEAAGVLQRGSGSEPWVSADHPSITSDDPAMADEVGAFLQTVRAGHGEPLTDFDQLRGFLGEHRNGQSGRDRVDHAFLYAFHQGISAYLTALGDEGNDLEANNVRISTEPFGQ